MIKREFVVGEYKVKKEEARNIFKDFPNMTDSGGGLGEESQRNK